MNESQIVKVSLSQNKPRRRDSIVPEERNFPINFFNTYDGFRQPIDKMVPQMMSESMSQTVTKHMNESDTMKSIN